MGDSDSASESDPGDTTVDTLLRGRVTLVQPRRGFRSSLDPLLLARFLAPPHGRFLDIGCGTGALAFTLLADDPSASGVGVELQARLAHLAGLGRARNALDDRFQVVQGDIRALAAALTATPFDLVATNPPFRVTAHGVRSPDSERARANHEVTLTLAEWLDCAARLVRPGGRLGVVYAAERLPELLAGMNARDLSPARLRAVHPFADRPAVRVLIEAYRQSRRTLALEPPLVLHEGGGAGRFTAEVQRMLEAERPGPTP
ncbi:MAG TPA: methyltransferase [Polyangia bacterium]|nr:methyltransferase [Polyangia bacterium]